jgi:hypothetical protein
MDVATLCTAARLGPLNPCWTPLRDALRGVWHWQDEFGFEALDGLVPVLMEAIRTCGGERMIPSLPLLWLSSSQTKMFGDSMALLALSTVIHLCS